MEPKRNIASKKIVIIMFFLLAISSLVVFVTFYLNKNINTAVENKIYDFKEEKVYIENNTTGISDIYIVDKKGFFYVSKDGVKFINFNGDEKFNVPYNMISPVMIGEGDFISVYEHKGNTIYTFSPEGQLYTTTLDLPIINVSINNSGFSSIICQKSEEDYTPIIINSVGEKVSGSLENYNVFPLATDISSDGKIQAISYLDINGSRVNSKLEYRYVTATDSNETNAKADGIFAFDDENEDEIIAIVRFMKNNNVILISDKKISCVDVQYTSDYENKYIDKWNVELNNEISNIAFNGDKGFAITLGKGIINRDSEDEGIVKYYDLNGNVLWTYATGSTVTYLSANNNSIIIGANNLYTILDSNGNKILNYKSNQPINSLKYVESKLLLVATDSKVSSYRAIKN